MREHLLSQYKHQRRILIEQLDYHQRRKQYHDSQEVLVKQQLETLDAENEAFYNTLLKEKREQSRLEIEAAAKGIESVAELKRRVQQAQVDDLYTQMLKNMMEETE